MLPHRVDTSPQAGRSRPAYAQSVLFTLALVGIARGILPPESPEVLRALAGLTWRLEARFRGPGALAEHARALGVSARAAEGLVRESRDLDLQRRLEELILARVEPEWLDRYAVVEPVLVEGSNASDVPEDIGSALLVGLPQPHPLIAALALSHHLPGLACVTPAETVGISWTARRLHRQFAAERASMRCNWIGVTAIEPHLAGGQPVFATLRELNFRGAELSLSGREPVGAAPTSVPVHPVLVRRARDKRWRVTIGQSGTFESAFDALSQHARRWPGQHLSG